MRQSDYKMQKFVSVVMIQRSKSPSQAAGKWENCHNFIYSYFTQKQKKLAF